MTLLNTNLVNVPKIDTNKIDDMVGELIKSFRMVSKTIPLWICGRSESFGFRPSLNRYLPDITQKWVSEMEQGKIIISPIIFYTCDANNIENVTSQEVTSYNDTNYFLVNNHYNVIISYINSNGIIQIERYEPANSNNQGKLNNNISNLFSDLLKKYTKRSIKFELVSPKGLQANYKDKTLCGHHILYWSIYRLKYGFKASVEMVQDKMSFSRFEKFCQCITDYRIGKCLS